MRRYIEHLKNKPEHHRKQIAFGVSSLVMVIIVMIWLSTFSGKFAAIHALRDNVPTDQLQAAAAAATSPFNALKQNLSDGIKNINSPEGTVNSNDVLISDPAQDTLSTDSYIGNQPRDSGAYDPSTSIN